MRIATANIGRGETPEEARAILRRVVDAFGGRMIVGWQEIDEADAPREHRLLGALLPPTTGRAGWATLNPITVAAPWQIVRQYTVHGCAGLAGYTPAREFVVAHVRNSARPNLPTIAVINAHAPIRRLRTASRRAAMVGVHRQIVTYELGRGHSVVWTEDTNDPDYPPIHSREVTLAHAGPDWIRSVEAKGGARFLRVASGSLDLNVDAHACHWVQLDVSGPA